MEREIRENKQGLIERTNKMILAEIKVDGKGHKNHRETEPR